MKNLFLGSMLFACSMLLVTGCTHKPATAATPQGVSNQKAQVTDRVQMAADDLNQLMKTPDAEVPQTILAKAKCVAVVPDMVKGGFIIGGKHGRGLATCRTANGWSAPAPITISGGSWGAQIGVQSADVVLLFMNQGAVDSLLHDKLKLGGEASIAAGPVGRDAQAATDVKLNSEILSYSRTKGLFAGLDLSGAAVRQDMDTTVAMYGHSIPFTRILSGQVRPPADSMAFIHAVSRDFQEAKSE
jgi:lipid-binding SYLF domain-containing protein